MSDEPMPMNSGSRMLRTFGWSSLVAGILSLQIGLPILFALTASEWDRRLQTDERSDVGNFWIRRIRTSKCSQSVSPHCAPSPRALVAF